MARLGPLDAFGHEPLVKSGEDYIPFAAVGDLDGDERPEIILHSNRRVLIYRSDRAAKVSSLKLTTGVNFTLY